MEPLIQTPRQQLEAAIAALDAGRLYEADVRNGRFGERARQALGKEQPK